MYTMVIVCMMMHKTTGILAVLNFALYLVLAIEDLDGAEHMKYTQFQVGNGIASIVIALATMWITVEDRGEHLLVAWGPCRCFLCGMGKEKIKYSNIRSYQISKTCFFGMGLLGAVKVQYIKHIIFCCGILTLDMVYRTGSRLVSYR